MSSIMPFTQKKAVNRAATRQLNKETTMFLKIFNELENNYLSFLFNGPEGDTYKYVYNLGQKEFDDIIYRNLLRRKFKMTEPNTEYFKLKYAPIEKEVKQKSVEKFLIRLNAKCRLYGFPL